MSRQFWSETIGWATASGTAVASTVTETNVMPTFTIPANYLQDGRSLKFTCIGQYSTTGAPTMLFGLRANPGSGASGTLLAKSAASTTPSGVTAAVFLLEVWGTVRTNGSAGTIMANGVAMLFAAVAGTVASATGAGLVTPMTAGGVVTPATASYDFTADTPYAFTLTWGTSSSSNTATGLNQYVESLN